MKDSALNTLIAGLRLDDHCALLTFYGRQRRCDAVYRVPLLEPEHLRCHDIRSVVLAPKAFLTFAGIDTVLVLYNALGQNRTEYITVPVPAVCLK